MKVNGSMLLQLLVALVLSWVEAQEADPRFQVETTKQLTSVIEKLGEILAQQNTQAVANHRFDAGHTDWFQSVERKVEGGGQILQDLLENLSQDLGSNNTCCLPCLKEIQVIRSRLAVTRAVSAFQLVVVVIYLVVTFVLYLVKCVRKKQEEQLETELELMEARLQERKATRKSVARVTRAKQ